MMSLIYIAHLRKKLPLGRARPPPQLVIIIYFVVTVTIAGGYLTTFQIFMVLPTREYEELVLIQIYIAQKVKIGFGAPGHP